MSWMSARDAQREKLEGSLLTVCVDCKEMVVQVRKPVEYCYRLEIIVFNYFRSFVYPGVPKEILGLNFLASHQTLSENCDREENWDDHKFCDN